MPEAPADHLQDLLAGLNEPQREAVTHGEGPLLILAGAGSGKTRVLTHRIAHLVGTETARQSEILAITFTNKAAQEMRNRVGLLLGASVNTMWVSTFHSACARLLRAEAPRLGYTRQFTIYDQQDSRRLVKRSIDEAGVDPKRFTPASVQHQISDAKNKLRDAKAYGDLVGDYFEQSIAQVYEVYERQLMANNAMDFDDLLGRMVNVLELFPEVRARYSAAFRHVLVDEYQDTNHAQYRLLQLIAGEHRNLAVVGDDDQCLIEGTEITMGDGSIKPIEEVTAGDYVLSSYGSGDMRPARVTSTSTSERADGVRILTAAGRELVSTPEHVHFAGYISTLAANRQVWTSKCAYKERLRTHTAGVTMTMCAERHRAGVVHRLDGPTSGARFASMSALLTVVNDAHRASVKPVARLGIDGSTLPLRLAQDVCPGMVMFTADGWDVVESVEAVQLERPVFDLNIENTHNFVANGVITHNSVYGFRGADIKNILNFQDDFSDATVVKLEQNYRSTQTILDAANAVISNNRGRMGKTLWTDLGKGDPIRVRGLDDEHAEARFIVGELGRMTDEGTSLDEIAIFYRTNAQSRVLEDQLVRAEIPYQVVGGTRFYERAEIKDAIAYLQAIANPADAISFARIVNSPRRGIGQTSLSRVLTHANTMGESIWDVASDPESVPSLGAAAVKALNRFMTTMNALRDRVADKVPVGDLVEALLHETGYIDALEAERTIEAEGRLENLQQLVEFAREFDARTEAGEDRLEGFLQEVSLVADADTRQDDVGLVTLMTLHNAKGLEYPIVFVIGAEDGVFPHSRSIEEGSIEEERRLAYVAITRAMRDLTLTFARRRNVFGSATSGVPSRFLTELPDELLDQEKQLGSSLGGPADRLRPRAVSSWATARHDAPATAFKLGEDVTHAAFGEGVVTGLEPGGVVVIHFAADGTERKLMADFAPLTKH